MISVFAATAAELAKLKPVRRGLLILGRYVVSTLACTTLKNNIIAWHNFKFLIFVLSALYLAFCLGLWSLVFAFAFLLCLLACAFF